MALPCRSWKNRSRQGRRPPNVTHRPGGEVYVEKLQLHGFKSFVARTEIPFSRGITAIVGPNGCGKSNVSDAFRWVIGESNVRNLRGERIQDVIFKGTRT